MTEIPEHLLKRAQAARDKAAEDAATTANAEVAKMGALIRQYNEDVERCDASITEIHRRRLRKQRRSQSQPNPQMLFLERIQPIIH